MTAHPLLCAPSLDEIVAWRPDGSRRVRELLADALALARLLPDGGYLFNVCEDRYLFAVGFFAGLLAGKISLQPASLSADTLSRLAGEFPDTVCLCEERFDSHGLARFEFPVRLESDVDAVDHIPSIEAERVAAILFTSGSTGVPQAHAKTWGRLVSNGRAEAVRLGLAGRPHTIVGTVPVQHSYGFESTFLQALQSGSAFYSGKPFFPQDVLAALTRVPAPRLLVTTPFHLSTLLAAGVDLPPVAQILSATAPLSAALAAEAEQRFDAPLLEIYGSTESGQLASRRTTVGSEWQLLDGVRLEQDGEITFACGGHVEGRVPLGDLIELHDDGRFALLGRHADLINIAGKRTSLAYLNRQICQIPGVIDAAFFLPPDSGHGVTRLCAFVVAPELDRAGLMAALRKRVDAVFLPRPLVLVDALPRNTTGKLPRLELEALYLSRVVGDER